MSNKRMIRVQDNNWILDSVVCIMIMCTLALYDRTPIVLVTQIVALGICIIGTALNFDRLTVRYFLWWIGFVFYTALSIAWSVNQDTTMPMMISIMQTAAISFVIIQYAKSEKRFDRMNIYIIVANVLLCFRLLVQVPRSAWGTVRIGNYIGYGNDGAAIVLCFGAIISFCSWLRNKKKIYLFFIILFISFSLFTGSRKGVLIISTGIFAGLLFSGKDVKRRIYIIILAAVIIGIAYYFLMNNKTLYDAIGNRLESLWYTLINGHRANTIYNNSSEERMLHIQYAWGFFTENPICGLGLDGYRKVCPIRATYAHNNILELLADFGIIGTLLYYIFPITVLLSSIKEVKNNRHYAQIIGLLLAFLICDIGMVTYNDEFIHIYFASTISLFILMKEEKEPMIINQKESKYIK